MPQPNQMKKMYLDMLAQHMCEVILKTDNGQVCLEVTRMPGASSRPEPTMSLRDNQIRAVSKLSLVNPQWIIIDLDKLLGFKILPNKTKPLQSGLKMTDTTSRAAKSQYASVGNSQVPSHQDAVLEARRDGYLTSLKTGIYEIIFTKSDNTERIMYGTLDPKIIVAVLGEQKAKQDDRTAKPVANLDVINVVDIQAGDWRSFKISKLKSFKPARVANPYRETTLTAV